MLKQSRNRPGVAQRVPGGLGSQISMTFGTWRRGIVSLTHRPPLPPGNIPGTHFHWGLSRPQRHGTVGRNMSLKNPVTPLGIYSGTVQLVAQRLNHYATSGSPSCPDTCSYHTGPDFPWTVPILLCCFPLYCKIPFAKSVFPFFWSHENSPYITMCANTIKLTLFFRPIAKLDHGQSYLKSYPET